ncbi:hypothetical protein CK218_09190 [Mesorhizobium sp. WSM3879]|nr:hypothetical protein CK218_09190 [Mesorhizobium sp. WSM3879]
MSPKATDGVTSTAATPPEGKKVGASREAPPSALPGISPSRGEIIGATDPSPSAISVSSASCNSSPPDCWDKNSAPRHR